MKKIHFFGTGIASLLVVSMVTGITPSYGQTINLKFAHFMSPMHIQHRKSFVPFTKTVGEITGGRVKIKMYPGGALGRPKQLPDAVKTGITDIAFIIPSFVTGRFPRMSVMDLPFMGGESAIHATRAIYDIWDQYLAQDFKDYKVLWVYTTAPGQFFSATKPMQTLDAFKGMKMRAPSAYGVKALKILGANPVGMPITKLTISLQKKVIDGTLTSYSAVTDFRLFDLIKYISEAHFYVTPMLVVMNKNKWNSLPDYARTAIDTAAGKTWGLHAADVYDEHDTNTVLEINKRGKIHIYKFNKSQIAELKAKMARMKTDWVKDISKKGIPAKEILEAAQSALARNR